MGKAHSVISGSENKNKVDTVAESIIQVGKLRHRLVQSNLPRFGIWCTEVTKEYVEYTKERILRPKLSICVCVCVCVCVCMHAACTCAGG
jgi:hypothetical protein